MYVPHTTGKAMKSGNAKDANKEVVRGGQINTELLMQNFFAHKKAGGGK